MQGEASDLCFFITTAIEVYQCTIPVSYEMEEKVAKCHDRLGLPVDKSYLLGQSLVWGFKQILSFQHDDTLWSLRPDNWYVNGTHLRKMPIIKAYMKAWSAIFIHMTNILHFRLCREYDQPYVCLSQPSSPLSAASESLLTSEFVSMHEQRSRRESTCSSVSSLGSQSSAGTQMRSQCPSAAPSSFASPSQLHSNVVASREPHVPTSPKPKSHGPLYAESTLTATLLPCIHSASSLSPYANNNVLLPKLASPLDDLSSFASPAPSEVSNSLSRLPMSDEEDDTLLAPPLRSLSIKPIDLAECESKPIPHDSWLAFKRSMEQEKHNHRNILTKIDLGVQFPIQPVLDSSPVIHPLLSSGVVSPFTQDPCFGKYGIGSLESSPQLKKLATPNKPFCSPFLAPLEQISPSLVSTSSTKGSSPAVSPYTPYTTAQLSVVVNRTPTDTPSLPITSLAAPQVQTPMFPPELHVSASPSATFPHDYRTLKHNPAIGVRGKRKTSMTSINNRTGPILRASSRRNLAPIGFLTKGNGSIAIQYSNNRQKLNSCC